MGLEGNLAAMRFVFERVVGRPADLPLEAQPLPLVLPELRTGGACAMATDSVLDGVCKGTIDRETAKVLLEGIQTRLKSIEVTDLQTRLGDLEKRADGVDFQARGSR